MNGIPLFDQGEAREALKKRCRKAKIPIATLDALVKAELEQVGKRRKTGLWDQFDELLGPSPSPMPKWRSNNRVHSARSASATGRHSLTLPSSSPSRLVPRTWC